MIIHATCFLLTRIQHSNWDSTEQIDRVIPSPHLFQGRDPVGFKVIYIGLVTVEPSFLLCRLLALDGFVPTLITKGSSELPEFLQL